MLTLYKKLTINNSSETNYGWLIFHSVFCQFFKMILCGSHRWNCLVPVVTKVMFLVGMLYSSFLSRLSLFQPVESKLCSEELSKSVQLMGKVQQRKYINNQQGRVGKHSKLPFPCAAKQWCIDGEESERKCRWKFRKCIVHTRFFLLSLFLPKYNLDVVEIIF